MKIETNVTIDLSEVDVKEMIADYLNRKGYGVKPDDVTLSVGPTTEGYGMSEHMVCRFNGAHVKYKAVIA